MRKNATTVASVAIQFWVRELPMRVLYVVFVILLLLAVAAGPVSIKAVKRWLAAVAKARTAQLPGKDKTPQQRPPEPSPYDPEHRKIFATTQAETPRAKASSSDSVKERVAAGPQPHH
jgi:hypothetical protein